MTSNDFLKQFKEEYFKKLELPYLPTYGRDQKIFKDILKDLDGATLTRLIKLYFTQTSNIYSVPFLKCSLNNLMQLDKKEKHKELGGFNSPEGWRYVE